LDLVQIFDGIGSSKERLIVLKTTLTFGLHKTHEFKGFCGNFLLSIIDRDNTINLSSSNTQILSVQSNVIRKITVLYYALKI